MDKDIRKELLERYQATGKIGFHTPKNDLEAYSLIECLSIKFEEPPEEVVLTLPEIAEKMKEFLEKF